MNITLFSQNIYLKNKVDLPHKKILNEIKKLPWDKVIPQIKHPSYDTRQYISKYNLLDIIPSKNLIKNVMKECVTEAINNFGYDSSFKICNSWANKILPQNISEFHNHKNFWLSLVYYPHGNFTIDFKKHDMEFFEIKTKKQNSFNNNMCSVDVKQGDIIIFPAYMLHKIGYNNTKENRYSIAVNILPKGVIGQNDGELNIK
jgi:hypothetical protein